MHVEPLEIKGGIITFSPADGKEKLKTPFCALFVQNRAKERVPAGIPALLTSGVLIYSWLNTISRREPEMLTYEELTARLTQLRDGLAEMRGYL